MYKVDTMINIPVVTREENFKTIHLITHVAAQYRTIENISKSKPSTL